MVYLDANETKKSCRNTDRKKSEYSLKFYKKDIIPERVEWLYED